ncbi:MAG TPA: DUF481 domain-containing protein [Puia sp.]|nr:DUF481 domain-containing protein [Puia sp.]
MKRALLFLMAMILYSLAFSQALKDTIFFTNGSTIIGKLKNIKLGIATFDPDDLPDITAKLTKLRTISAVRTIFRIETITHQIYYGKMVPNEKSQFVNIVRNQDTIELDLKNISLMYPFKNSFFQRFSGNFGAGFSYARSSDFGQMNFNGRLNYASQKEEISLSASGNYSITDSSFSRDREDASLKYNHYFNTTWFASAFLGYQHNLELGLQRRFQEGLGIGNKYITTQHVYAWARTGFVINQEKNLEGVSTGTLGEIYGDLEFNFFRFTKPEVNFVLAETFFYSVSQSGRFRNDGQVDLYWEIIRNLKLNIGFYHNFDNQPPGAESRNFDFGIVFGLNYTFYL